ncbi:MAG TPA: NUDIX hydrolase [Herpetosiphonaceae bacterium]
MSREYPAFPLPGVAVIVWRGAEALLIQRGKQPNYGHWNIPGGMVELGETVAEAARREIREECGVEISEPELLTTVDVIDRDEAGRVRFHYVLVELTASWLSGEPAAGDDALAVRWVRPEELDGLPMWEQTRAVVRQAWERERGRREAPPPGSPAGGA